MAGGEEITGRQLRVEFNLWVDSDDSSEIDLNHLANIITDAFEKEFHRIKDLSGTYLEVS